MYVGVMTTEDVCPVCGGAATTWFDLPRGRIARCRQSACGLGFMTDQPSNDELAGFYETYYYPDHLGDALYENSTTFKSIQHFEALDDRVGLRGVTLLDYGCGVGSFLDVAAGRGADVRGVESDPEARRRAVQRGFDVVPEIEDVDLASVDFVYMNDVIEHLRDPVAALVQLRRRLRPGGSIFVVTMNMRGLLALVKKDRWGVVTNPTHLWFYDPVSLRVTLEAAGFEAVREQRWRVDFDHHGSTRRLLQRRLQQFGRDGSLRMLATRP